MDTFTCTSIDHVISKINTMNRKFNNLSDGQKKTMASSFNAEVKQLELLMRAMKTRHDMNKDKELKELIKEVEDLKRHLNLKVV